MSKRVAIGVNRSREGGLSTGSYGRVAVLRTAVGMVQCCVHKVDAANSASN